MRLVVLGLNHKTVPVTIREQFAVSEKAPEAACVIWMSSQGSMRPLSFLHATEPRFMQFSAMQDQGKD